MNTALNIEMLSKMKNVRYLRKEWVDQILDPRWIPILEIVRKRNEACSNDISDVRDETANNFTQITDAV